MGMASAGVPQKRPQVFENLDNQGNAIDRLDALISELGARLDCVRQVGPRDPENKAATPSPNGVAGMIHTRTERIVHLADEVQMLLNELEV